MALALFVAADAFTPGVHAPAVRRSAVAPVAQPVMMVSTLGKKEPVSMRAPRSSHRGSHPLVIMAAGATFGLPRIAPASHVAPAPMRPTHASAAARPNHLVQLSHAHAKLLCLSP